MTEIHLAPFCQNTFLHDLYSVKMGNYRPSSAFSARAGWQGWSCTAIGQFAVWQRTILFPYLGDYNTKWFLQTPNHVITCYYFMYHETALEILPRGVSHILQIRERGRERERERTERVKKGWEEYQPFF